MDLIELIKRDLRDRPSPSLILSARWEVYIRNREGIESPDWLRALADGSTDLWELVCRTAAEELALEEAQDGNGIITL